MEPTPCIAVEVTKYALENCYEQHFVHSAGIEHSPKPIAVLKQVYPLPLSCHLPDGKREADRKTCSVGLSVVLRRISAFMRPMMKRM